MSTVPLICWIVMCGPMPFNCSTVRIEVTSAAHCDRETETRRGVFTSALGHLLPVTTQREYERECGKEGRDCK